MPEVKRLPATPVRSLSLLRCNPGDFEFFTRCAEESAPAPEFRGFPARSNTSRGGIAGPNRRNVEFSIEFD